MPKSALPTGSRKSAGSSATPKANTSKDKKQQQQTQPVQQTQQAQKNYPSKKAAWVADQISQRKKPEQRNFLAEIAEEDRQKATEKQQSGGTFLGGGNIYSQEANKKETKPINTNKERDELLKQYNAAVDNEREAAAWATDDLGKAAADDATATRKGLEEQLKEMNRNLGNEVYADLSDESQARDLFEGWAGERAAGSAAALGTALEWFDKASDDMTRYEYDQEHGEGAYDAAIAGKNVNQLTDAGQSLFNAAKGWQEQAESDWASGTEDMSETGKQIAGMGKTAADMSLDMIENMILPGSGRLAMAARVAGGGALTQDSRENNDIDTRAAKMAFDGATAFLSEYLIGGAEAVYGKSVLGKGIAKAFGEPGPLLKAVLNTEGLEEGLEYALGYAGDKILGFDQNGEFSKDELKQNMLVGYIMGVLFNGVAGGINYDAAKLRAVVDEAVEATQQGITPQEAAEQARLQPNEEVKIDPSKQVTEEAEVTAEPEAETAAPETTTEEAPINKPTIDNSMDTGANTEKHNRVRSILSGGALSESDIDTILSGSAYRQAFKDVTGVSLDGMDYETARQTVGMAAGSVPVQGAPAIATETPVNETIAAIQERGTISPREAARIQRDPALRAAFEEAYGVGLEGMGEAKATQAITDAVNERKAIERATGEFFEVPLAEPSETEGPGEKGSKDRKEYNRAMKAKQDVADILAGDNLSRKDATRLMSDKIMWQAFVDATDIDLNGKPKTEQNIREAFKEAKANMPSEPEATVEPEPEVVEPAPEPKAEANEESAANNEQTAEQATEEKPTAEPTAENSNTEQQSEELKQENTTPKEEKPKKKKVESNPEGVAGPKIPDLKDEVPSKRRERISQFFTNTLTESGRAKGLDPFKYNVKSEAESLTNAIMALDEKGLETFENLMNAPAWSGEMVDSAWVIENEYYKEFVKTGKRERLDAWKKVEDAKIRETARGLQAVAKQSRPGAAGVLNAMINEIQAAKESGVSKEVCDKAETKANEIARRMAELENKIDDAVNSGMSEADAKASVKEAYLDLADEINVFRHTGFIQDAKTNAKMRKSAEKLNTKFRKMLAGEDMDYIQRFVACDAAGISEDVHYDGKQDFLKRLNTWQKLAQLTGTGTWLRNGVGNGSFGIVDVVSADNPVTWLTDMLVSTKTGKRSSAVEGGFLNKKARDAAAHALHRSMLEVAANIDLAEGDQTKYDMSRTRTHDPNGEAFERMMSRWEQWNGYMLQSSDAWFKGMAEGSVRDSLIKANGWDADALTPEQNAQLDEAAKQVAEYRTFQNDSRAAEAANKLRDGLNKLFNKNWKQGEFGVGTALMPYTKVPTNLAVKSFEFSPAGAVNGLYEIVKVMNDPNATMAQQNKAVTDFGRGVTGTMLIAALTHLMKKYPFFKDWAAEDDKDVLAQNKAEGKSGMQLNTSLIMRALKGDKGTEWQNGDKTIDISSMEPLNQLIATASLLANEEELNAKTVGNAFYKSTRDSALGMPALQTLANIENTIKYSDTPDDGLATAGNTIASTLGNVAGGLIPGPIKHATVLADDKVRDTSGNNAIERSVNQAKSAIPGLRKTLPVKTDAFGNEMTSGSLATRFGNQYDSFKHNEIHQSDVSKEIERLHEATDEVLVPSRNGPSSVTFGSGADKETVKLTTDERQQYKNELGKDYEKSVKELMADPVYQIADDQTKAAMMKELEKFSKDTAKANLAEEHDIKFESDYEDIRELDDPVAFLTAKIGYNTAKKDDNWNAVDTLLDSVRGGQLSDAELDYYEEHIQGFKKLYAMSGQGVSSKKIVDFGDSVKELYESEKRNSARGSDYIRIAGSGKFSDKEADVFMNYAPEISQKTIDGYKEQLQYQLTKAGVSDAYDQVWDRIEKVVNGDLENADFKKWVDKNIPLEQRQEIKSICSNYAKDRTESGKTVSGIYKAMRDTGYTAQQALQFYEMIDTNYNGYYTKAEFDKACKKAFGSSEYGKQVRKLIKEYVGK